MRFSSALIFYFFITNHLFMVKDRLCLLALLNLFVGFNTQCQDYSFILICLDAFL